jgi:thioredoxin reductase
MEKQYDIVIYGGTAAGIVAAVQAKIMGKSVVVIDQEV